MPILSTRGRMWEAGAEGRESEWSNEGRIFEIKKGGGRVSTLSLIRLNRLILSASPASSNPSSESTSSIRLFPCQYPVAATSSTKRVVGNLVRALGLSMRLYRGKRDFGMDPIEEGCGAADRLGSGLSGL